MSYDPNKDSELALIRTKNTRILKNGRVSMPAEEYKEAVEDAYLLGQRNKKSLFENFEREDGRNVAAADQR